MKTNFNYILGWTTGQLARPYGSTDGVPSWFFWIAIIVLGYIVLRVYLAIQKDKK